MRLRTSYLALGAVVALLLSTGCALFLKGGKPVPTDTQIAQLKAIDQARRVGEAAVDAVTNVYKGEIVAYGLRKPDGSRFITPKQHQDVADVVTAFGLATKDALATLKNAASAPLDVQKAAQLILDQARAALGKIAGLSPDVKGYVDTALGLIEVLIVPRL